MIYQSTITLFLLFKYLLMNDNQSNMFSTSIIEGIDAFKSELSRDSVIQESKDSVYISNDPNISIVEKPVTIAEILNQKKLR